MERIAVSSTELASVGYDESNSVMEVEFQQGGVYQYFGVPADVYAGLMAASSKGTYFNQIVKKGGYPYSKV
jgi:hypothetical protein